MFREINLIYFIQNIIVITLKLIVNTLHVFIITNVNYTVTFNYNIKHFDTHQVTEE